MGSRKWRVTKKKNLSGISGDRHCYHSLMAHLRTKLLIIEDKGPLSAL